jgi:prevent-host-death family protein
MTVRTVDSNRARIHWREILDAARAGEDSVIEHYGKTTAVVLPFADWEALQEALDDLRAARRGQVAYEAWQRDPSLGRPWSEVKAELIRDGLLEV